MKRCWMIGLLILAAARVGGAESCCIDERFAQAFLNGSTFSRAWPDEFPVAPIDSGDLEFIGSRSTHGQNASVAWESSADPLDAFGTVRHALTAQDWREIPSGGATSFQMSGFVLANTAVVRPELPTGFCKANHIVHVTYRPTDRGSVLTLNATHVSRTPAPIPMCDVMIQQAEQQALQSNGAMHFRRAAEALPLLRLPASIETMSMGDTEHGMSAAGRTAMVVTDLSAGALIHHFDSQMNDQGWFSETAFGAGDFVGSIWRKDGDNGTFSASILAHERNDDVLLRLSVANLDATNRMSGAGMISTVGVARPVQRVDARE